jgi:hypothetical protein
VRRALPNRDRLEAVATEPPIRVLLVSPRPEDDRCGFFDHRASARPLVEALSRLGDLAEFTLLAPPTLPELEKELQRGRDAEEPYHVVHFDGHGVYLRELGRGALCFEDPADSGKLEKRRSALVIANKLAEVIRDHRIPLFFLGACQSAMTEQTPGASVAGSLLQGGVSSVVAMSHSVLVETARRFVTPFYRELMSGRRVGRAMLAGQRELAGDDYREKTFTGELRLQDWFVPVLFQEKLDPQLIQEMPAEKVQAVMKPGAAEGRAAARAGTLRRDAGRGRGRQDDAGGRAGPLAGGHAALSAGRVREPREVRRRAERAACPRRPACGELHDAGGAAP